MEDLRQHYNDVSSCRITESFQVQNLILVRGTATIELQSGVIEMSPSTLDRTHTAVFSGKGNLRFDPPSAIEEDQLMKFARTKLLEAPFDSAVFRFTDLTAEELRKGNAGQSPKKQGTRICQEASKKLLKNFRWNVDSRVLRDLYSRKSGYFLAYVSSRNHGELLLEIDPENLENVTLKQVRQEFVDTWSSFSSPHHSTGDLISIPHFEVEVEINKNGDMKTTAILDVIAQQDSVDSIPFALSPLIEVDNITDGQDNSCFFIYEVAEDPVGGMTIRQNKLDVFLPAPLQKNQTAKLKFTLQSTDAIYQIDNGKEYLIRSTMGWYPTYGYLGRSTSTATYRYPKDLELMAVGRKMKEWQEDDNNFSTWYQEIPVAMVSFNIGDFKHKEITLDGLPQANIFSGKKHSGLRLGGDPLQNVAADVMNSLNFFQTLYGAYPFPSIVATEIPAFHGQGFPGFLHLSSITFDDASMAGKDEFFRAHEVSHQWWGHVVGWRTYHDQWLSEGFANYSGAWFADATETNKNKNLLLDIVEDWKNDVLGIGNLSLTRYGFFGKLSSRATMGSKTGPLWLGSRLASSRSPVDYHIMVYEKGGYVLHMLRMMMRDFEKHNDDQFLVMMKDFVQTYRWTNASTEDFQKVAEKHVGSSLQWFFDQWVYGSQIPKYKFTWSTEPGKAGKVILVCRVQQSNVSSDFRMPVPVHIDFGKDRFAVVRILADQPDKTVRIPLPEKPKAVTFNHLLAVLSSD